MRINEQEGTFKINGYQVIVYRNDDDDILIRQPNFYEEDAVVIVGKEQVTALIKALKTIPSTQF